MDDINSVTLLGRLTADPELRTTGGGTSVCSFRVAFNTSKKGSNGWEDVANFINITVWGSQGESCSRYLAKGKQVAIDGRLQYREWESDGGRRNVIEIVANRVQFIGPRDENSSNSSPAQPAPQPVRADDDIPF